MIVFLIDFYINSENLEITNKLKKTHEELELVKLEKIQYQTECMEWRSHYLSAVSIMK